MFQVDANLWLQQFSAPWIFALMEWLSALGRSWVYSLVVIGLAYGVRLRPMLGVMLALVLAGAATDTVKQAAGLPRPSEVDARVLDKGESGEHLVADGAARTFWSLPQPHGVAAARETGRNDYGFLSGHVSSATALALALALLLGPGRRRWLLLAAAWAVLMALSRMYLGRHFLADAMAGGLLGVLAAGMAVGLLRASAAGGAPARRAWWLAGSGAALLCVVSLAWVPFDPYQAGSVAGMLLSIGWLHWRGWPRDAASIAIRVARVACAMGFIYGLGWLLEVLHGTTGWPDRHAGGMLFALIGFPLSLVGAVEAACLLRLYPGSPTRGSGTQGRQPGVSVT